MGSPPGKLSPHPRNDRAEAHRIRIQRPNSKLQISVAWVGNIRYINTARCRKYICLLTELQSSLGRRQERFNSFNRAASLAAVWKGAIWQHQIIRERRHLPLAPSPHLQITTLPLVTRIAAVCIAVIPYIQCPTPSRIISAPSGEMTYSVSPSTRYWLLLANWAVQVFA